MKHCLLVFINLINATFIDLIMIRLDQRRNVVAFYLFIFFNVFEVSKC